MRIAALIVLAAGCHGYQPGSFSHALAAHAEARATVGCIDIAAEPRFDSAAVGPVLRVAVANRCDRAVQVDLGAIRARGDRVDHRPFDPRGEIRPALLDGRATAAETIEYRPVAPVVGYPRTLCLDVSAIAGSGQKTPPLCVRFDTAVAGVER